MKQLILLVFIACSNLLQAQYHDNNWMFGYSSDPDPNCDGVQMHFPGQSLVIDTFICGIESVISELVPMSDSSGNLLFYFNGMQMVDANQQLMPNGNNFNPGYVHNLYAPNGYPMQFGAIAVPHPDSSFLYEVFHLAIDSHPVPFLAHRLYRSQVDMRLNAGLGDVTIKNEIRIQDTLAYGQLQAVKHANGKDWWIVIPESGTNGYYSLLVKSDTIEGPFYQQVGTVMSPYDWNGMVSFSPDGTKYARYRDNIDLFDFDRCTGELCNQRHIQFPMMGIGGGCAFAANSKILYVANQGDLYQIDLQKPFLLNNMDTIWSGSLDSFCNLYFLQLAPDNKIYIICGFTLPYLSVIHQPDSLGLACNFQYEGINLPSVTASTLPNFPHYRTPPLASCPPCVDDTTGVYVVQKEEEGFNIYPNPAHTQLTVQWLLEDNKTGYRIQIYNALGQIIHNETVIGQDGQHSLDVSKWMNGIYFLSLYDGGKLIGTKTFSIKTE